MATLSPTEAYLWDYIENHRRQLIHHPAKRRGQRLTGNHCAHDEEKRLQRLHRISA